MTTEGSAYTWSGVYVFRINGSALHEDTLRVRSNYRKQEQMLKLLLPTLCITYADVKFQNSIGGEQENYPASRAYGPAYFDPPVEIAGERDIEKFTYIRGAERVRIGPRETVIEFPSWKELVIPRLRIDREKPAEAALHVPATGITVDEPLRISALQYADGRHIGGVSLEKRHPNWRPEKIRETYELWLRVIDGSTMQPLPEAMVDILHREPKAAAPGGFRLDDRRYTGGDGTIHVPERPSGELEAFVVRMPGRRAVVRCLRPLAGQKVRFHMRVWPLGEDGLRYVWKAADSLDRISGLTGHTQQAILSLNGLEDASRLKPGMEIVLPCYAATYRMEQWDSFDEVGKRFGYRDAEGLAEANGLTGPEALDCGADIRLPGWRFFYAREGDTLEDIDALFGLPKGSTITVGRVYHPDPRLPYPGETIAVPSPGFAGTLKKKEEKRPARKIRRKGK